jgi:hypothetical protein
VLDFPVGNHLWPFARASSFCLPTFGRIQASDKADGTLRLTVQQGDCTMQEIINAKENGGTQSAASVGPGCSNKKLAAARKEIECYVACVFAPTDMVEVRLLPSGKRIWHQASRLAEATEALLRDNEYGEHIHAGVNPRHGSGGSSREDVACARCLFVDFDGIEPDVARERWENVGMPKPTLTVASGHGIHAYWRLSEQMTDMVLWSGLQKRLIELLDSDRAIHDPARLMRLPGFMNHKEPAAACRIVEGDRAWTYDLNHLISLLYSKVTESDYKALYRAAGGFEMRLKKPVCRTMNAVKVAKLTAAKWSGVTKGGRNRQAFQNAAYLLKNLGLTEEQAWPILQHWNCSNRPALPEQELRQALRNAGIYGRHKIAG